MMASPDLQHDPGTIIGLPTEIPRFLSCRWSMATFKERLLGKH